MHGRERIDLVAFFVFGGVEIRKETVGGGFLVGRGGGPHLVFGGLGEVILPLTLPRCSRHGLRSRRRRLRLRASAATTASSVFSSILVLEVLLGSALARFAALTASHFLVAMVTEYC